MLFTIDIYTTKSGNDLVVCTGTDYLNPFSLLKEIKEKWISTYNSKPTEMLFDMYKTNGDSDNRFAKISFDGRGFEPNTFSIVSPKNIDPEVIRSQNNKFHIPSI